MRNDTLYEVANYTYCNNATNEGRHHKLLTIFKKKIYLLSTNVLNSILSDTVANSHLKSQR